MAGSEAPALRKPPATATPIRLPLPRQSPTLLRCYSKAIDWHRSECSWIAKSVTRYCRRNLASGQTQRQFPLIQSARGQRSGVERRKRNTERDVEIVARVEAGESKRNVARDFGLDESTVRHIVARGAG